MYLPQLLLEALIVFSATSAAAYSNQVAVSSCVSALSMS